MRQNPFFPLAARSMALPYSDGISLVIYHPREKTGRWEYSISTGGGGIFPDDRREFAFMVMFKMMTCYIHIMALRDKILEVVGGPHPAAVATVAGRLPAVRFMVLNGFPDMTFVGGTMKNSKKVEQLSKNPQAAISIWSGKEFSDPYVEIQAKAQIHEDVATKKKYWNPMFEQYFKSADNPDFVVLVFSASEIVYHGPNMMSMEVWKR